MDLLKGFDSVDCQYCTKINRDEVSCLFSFIKHFAVDNKLSASCPFGVEI